MKKKIICKSGKPRKNQKDITNKICVKYDTLRRNQDKTISNLVQVKAYGITYSKREVLKPDEYGNIDTIPFGYNYKYY